MAQHRLSKGAALLQDLAHPHHHQRLPLAAARPRDHRAFRGRGRRAAGRLAAPGGEQRRDHPSCSRKRRQSLLPRPCRRRRRGCALAITLYYGRATAAEIAELLDTTAENVRQRLSRGRKRIARLGLRPRGVAANEEPDGPRRISERGCRPRAPAETDAPLMQAANPA
ncbi:MAG: sigma factor-like helix-turn-helix DNA-binding protein [Adlercreutzia equolifaciens]